MNYLQEWQQSCVDRQLIDLNVTALQGAAATDYLFYSDQLPRRNDGRVSESLLQRYQHTEQGGWWCAGIDITTGEKDIWGCFKPNSPRLSVNSHKIIKYEHPPQTPTGIFALQVPITLWQAIAKKFGCQMDENRDFWQWILDNPQIPLIITEGAKKAGALLSAGYAAIALPGINNGYRTPKDSMGNRIGKSHLIPQLAKFTGQGRKIYLVFDQDSKPNTIKAVNAAIRKLGYLFTQSNCVVSVVSWPLEWGKGVDDLIANRGKETFDDCFAKALPLESWKVQELNQLTYAPQLEVNSAYLPAVNIPETAALIGIKSPKGTGKTTLLETVVKKAIAQQKKVLVIGHRIKLVEALCQRFSLPYVTEVRDQKVSADLGYGLCIDSLHPNSQIQFQAKDWQNSIIIIDEIEQVLWHGLNASTCKNNRVNILKSFKALMQTVLGEGGQVYLADSDLSDISLDYIAALAGFPLQPFIIQNHWKPSPQQTWKVNYYVDNSPKRWVKDLVKAIRQGERPFVCLSAQKLTSQWGTQTLETYLSKQFPQHRILRIDSESLVDPNHHAYNSMQQLDEVLQQYEIVLASPSIETGISIDLKGHFTSVWCLAQGIQTTTSVCQTLSRIRDKIPRYLWVANSGFNKVGNGSTSIPNLLTSGHRLTQLNIRLLQGIDLESLDDLDTGFQAESLMSWAKMAVRVNVGMINYRQSVLSLLQQENHEIVEHKSISSKNKLGNCQQLADAISQVRDQNYQAECKAIAYARDLTPEQYQNQKKRLIKSPRERQEIRKYILQQRYEIPITPQIVTLDDEGWYQKLRIHYFLTIGRQFLADRDSLIARKLIENGQGSLFMPDFNRSQFGVIIGILEVLGIPVLLNSPNRVLTSRDPDLQIMSNLAIHNRNDIKTVLKIGLAQNSSPITIIRRLVNLMGINITCTGTKKVDQKRVRTYQIVDPEDQRYLIFRQWLFRDEKCPGSSEPWSEEYLKQFALKASHDTEEKQKYVQLNLDL
ncbi:MAG: plasmid replication protein, CyRepA1 family [Microcystaceae cyanobacterium]